MKIKAKLVFVLSIFLVIALSNIVAMSATVSTDGSFEGETDGANINETDEFTYNWGLSIINGEGIINEEDGNKFLSVTGFSEFYSYEPIEAPYTYSIDIKLDTPGDVNIFVRSGRNEASPFPFYEWDWYVEKGGKNGASSTGGPGLIVSLQQDAVRVRIKNMQTDAENERISSVYYDFTGIKDYDFTKFNNIKFVDDGEKIAIYFNNELLATCEMSEKGTYEGDSETVDFMYFKKAVLKNAEGVEVLNLDNARLVAESSLVAFSTRNHPFYADNITLSYEVEDTPEPTQTPEATEKPAATPSKTNSIATQKPADDADNDFNPVWLALIASTSVAVIVVVVIIVRKRK